MNLLSILGLAGAGIGGAQKGYNQWQEQDLKEKALAQQAALKREEMAQNQSQFDATRLTDVEQLTRLGILPGMNVQPGEKLPTIMLPAAIAAAQKRQQDTEDRADREAAANTIQAGAGQRSTLTADLAPGEDPEAAAMIPRTPN